MEKLNKEEWLSKMPDLIYKLKLNYNFYFNGFYCHISRDILDIVKNPKNRHKICIYNRGRRFFLVVYTKKEPVIYFTNEYENDEKLSRIRYFMKKFKAAYKKAEKEYEMQQFSPESNFNC